MVTLTVITGKETIYAYGSPIAIERRARERRVGREIIRRDRGAQVPLGSKMGTAWDMAAAAALLASDEARYITGMLLLVDGGLSARIG
jgi:NAD(P)-dependent dehydrogenase (short-subunit alcohol dehydrogenase family)